MSLFSDLMFVGECLLDEFRVKAFEKAINEAVSRNSIVLDAGTGTGIMAMLAARAGAKKVIAVEFMPELAEVAKKNIEINGFKDKIEIVSCNILDYKRSVPVDIIIMEMMDTGLIQEYQGPAILALRENGVISDQTKLLPDIAECNLQLAAYNFNFYGFEMPFILQARNEGAHQRLKLEISEIMTYQKIDLDKFQTGLIDTIVDVPVLKSGIVNAVELTTVIKLGNDRLGHTSDMNMPIIVPLKEFNVIAGQTVRLEIKYLMGKGFVDSRFSILATTIRD